MRRISAVASGSLAHRRGIMTGDVLLSMNGEPVIDDVDYQALSAHRRIHLCLRKPDGEVRQVTLIKDASVPLGLQFDDSIIGNPRTCGNNCVFCFVNQMPEGMRKSLYVKDDDWRLSLLMGNYITLTNVGETEFTRIIRRKASPLYISVHATDMKLRAQMMGNKNGALLMDRLKRLKQAGLSYHLQLVLCLGLNDGEVLKQSLVELLALHPAAVSVAAVPVGLTRHREGLPSLRPYGRKEAADVIGICETFQKEAIDKAGTRFIYPADEFFSISGHPVPDAAYYEHFAQIENGVGMLRLFEDEIREAIRDKEMPRVSGTKRTVLLPCGTAVAPYLKEWVRQYAPDWINALVVPIRNDFFGETVTVSGLITAGDLIKQLSGIRADEVFIVDNMLNSDKTLFLDDLSPEDVQNALGLPVRVVRNHGGDFFRALAGRPSAK